MPTPQHPISSRNTAPPSSTSGPDHKHKCGCVTFWFTPRATNGTALFREACGLHRPYANRLGVLLHDKPRKTRNAA